MLLRPLLPVGDAAGPFAAAAEAGDAAYLLHPFAPEPPVAVEAQVGALVKRVEATDSSGALVPTPQSTPVPVAYDAFVGAAPEGAPPRGTAASPRLPTGPPRFHV